MYGIISKQLGIGLPRVIWQTHSTVFSDYRFVDQCVEPALSRTNSKVDLWCFGSLSADLPTSYYSFQTVVRNRF